MSNACPVCEAPVPLPLTLCARCAEAGWDDGPHFLTGAEAQTYLGLLRGERPKAPQGWYQGDAGRSRGFALLRFGVRCVQGARTRTAVLKIATYATMGQLRLRAWLSVQALTVYDAFCGAFPEADILPWEMSEQVPRSYWEQHGDTARRAALRWWLAREGWSARDVLALHEGRKANVKQLLVDSNLAGLLHGRTIREALRLVDPSIPADAPPSARERYRRAATIVCPWCGVAVKELGPHRAWKHPDRTAAELRQALGERPASTPDVFARRSAARQGPRTPDDPYWVAEGLSLPASYWPTGAPYAVVAFRGPAALLLPALAPTEAARPLRREGTRWVLRMLDPRARRTVEGARIAREGDRVVLLFESEEAQMPFRIWSKGQRVISDLALLPSRAALMVREDLWPQSATHAAVGYDEAARTIGVLPVTDKGRIAQNAHRKAPVPIEGCYKVRWNGRRVVIGAQAFLIAVQPPSGKWRSAGTDEEGFIVFVYEGALDREEEIDALEAAIDH